MRATVRGLAAALPVFLLLSSHVGGASKKKYEEDFDFLCRKVKETYPYFQDKKINWDSVCDKFKRQIRKVKSDEEFVVCCAELIAQLNDSHCALSDIKVKIPSPELRWTGMTLSPFGEKEAIVLRVAEGSDADGAGVKPGLILTHKDGKPLEQWMERFKEESRRGYSTRQALWYHGVSWLAWGLPERNAAFSFRAGKKKVSARLGFGGSRGDSLQAFLPQELSEGQCIRCARLSDNIGYVLLRGTPGEGSQPSAEFADELKKMGNALKGVSGVLVDARMNGGGSTSIGWLLLGYFIKNPVQTIRWGTIAPQEESLGELPVVMLIDAACISAGDQLADTCKASKGRFILAGKPTAGSSGQPTMIEMPNGLFSARISSRRFLDYTGQPIEGRGVEPDIPIEWDPQDVAAGRDTFIIKGLEILAKRAGK